MESQPHNPEFKINPETFTHVFIFFKHFSFICFKEYFVKVNMPPKSSNRY